MERQKSLGALIKLTATHPPPTTTRLHPLACSIDMPPTRIIWTLGRMGLQGKAGALTACRGEARVRERGGRRRLGQQKCPHPFHLCPPSPTSATSIAIAQTVCPHHSRLYLCSASGWAAQRRQQRAGDVSCTGQLAFAFPNHLSLVALPNGFGVLRFY